MRVPFTRRAAIAASIVAIAMAPLAACSSDDDSSSESSTTKASASETTSAAETTTAAAAGGAAADEATTKAITDAYVLFFNGQTPPAERAAVVENGQTFLPVLEGMTANPQAMGTSATVGGVSSVDANNANVTWTLNLNGAPVLPNQTGQAINDAGTWKVSAATFCALLAIQG
uniref:hypothetical protein n=1 Tax=Aldersonia kunmingensis TaxID=408066 RepID=UPI0008327576